MNFDSSAVKAEAFDFDLNSMVFLKSVKHPLENATFGSTVHSGVNRMPVTIFLRKASPFASMLDNIKHRI